jgi:hypothetical protein
VVIVVVVGGLFIVTLGFLYQFVFISTL